MNYLKELTKKIRKRIHLWFITLIILILADEYIKEGYLIKPSDFIKPLTHENILLIVITIYAIILCFIRRRTELNK